MISEGFQAATRTLRGARRRPSESSKRRSQAQAGRAVSSQQRMLPHRAARIAVGQDRSGFRDRSPEGRPGTNSTRLRRLNSSTPIERSSSSLEESILRSITRSTIRPTVRQATPISFVTVVLSVISARYAATSSNSHGNRLSEEAQGTSLVITPRPGGAGTGSPIGGAKPRQKSEREAHPHPSRAAGRAPRRPPRCQESQNSYASSWEPKRSGNSGQYLLEGREAREALNLLERLPRENARGGCLSPAPR